MKIEIKDDTMNDIKHYFTDMSDGNLAYHVNDKKSNVDFNREKLAKKLNYNNDDLVYMDQIHGKNVVIVDENSPKLIENCDGIITASKNLPLMVMVADCIPILIFDKNRGVIAAVHAGRNSTFLKIAQETVYKMIDNFECNVKDIQVIMGPSIQKCCYEVSKELEDIVINTFGKRFTSNGYIDLQSINKHQLQELGVDNITIYSTCTKCSNEPYYSYRKDKNCGRFAGVIMQ